MATSNVLICRIEIFNFSSCLAAHKRAILFRYKNIKIKLKMRVMLLFIDLFYIENVLLSRINSYL